MQLALVDVVINDQWTLNETRRGNFVFSEYKFNNSFFPVYSHNDIKSVHKFGIYYKSHYTQKSRMIVP